ncbi:probable helicase with zinc finger domain [Lingula anatina]|uniref:Probable helicase with zinc finger domain n=1 Tax=Lingula anatina TaxID=7574 RepID=A0A2R2MTB4_LINAN|nr:probable helicase with zinc finger domain [Lingula anatina]|eukprot:XP_023933501.1 probable helicase with zinc finger domain [Lingula anatina]
MEKHERNLLRYLEDGKRQSLRQLSEGIKYANQIINKEKLSIQSRETLSFFQKLAELHKMRANRYKNQAEIDSDLSVALSAYEDLFKASCILGFWDKSLASDRKCVLPLISGQLTKSQGQPAVFARAKQMLKKLEECGRKTLIEGDKAGAMFIYQDAAELGKYLLHLQKECPDTQQLAAKCHVSYAEILYNMGFDKESCQEKGHHLETALKACTDGIEIIQSKCMDYGANGHMGQLHFWKANVLRCQKKYSEAMDAVNLAIECDSKNEDFLNDLKYSILEECQEFCFTETHESEAFSEEIPDLASSEKEYSSIMSEKLVDTRTYANVTSGLSRENLSRSDSIASLSSVTSLVKIPGVNLDPAEPVSSACAVASSEVPSVQEKEFRKFQIFETCGQCYKEDHKRLVARQKNKCEKRNHTWNPVFVCKDNVEPSCQYVQIRKPHTQTYFTPRLCKYLNTKWGCIKKACNYAHSKQEMLVWRWMKRNQVSELTDALQASERYFQTVKQCPRSPSKKPSIKHVSAKIPVSQAHFYECGVCCKKWKHRSEFDKHLNSEKHLQQLRASQSWTHRCPPDAQQYTLCDQHISNKSCQYSNVVSQYNFCQHAHSREELKEWEERKRENKAFHSLKKEEHRDFYELYKNILHCQTKPNELKELVTDTCVPGVKVEVKPSLGSTTGPMELHQQHQVQEGRTLQWNFQVKIKDKTKRLQKVYLLRDRFRSHFHFINKSENAQVIQFNSDSGSKYVFGVEFTSHGQQGAFDQWLILDFGDRPVLRMVLKVDAETDACKFNTEDVSQAGSTCSLRLRQPTCMNCDAEDGSDETESSVFEELAAKYPIVDWPLCYSHSGKINFFSYKSMMHTYLEEQKRKEMDIVHGKATILSLKLHKQLPVKIHESKHETDGCIFGEVKQDLCDLEPALCQLLLTAVSKVYLQPDKEINTGHICKATVLNYADYLATGTPRKALYIRMSQKCATRLKLEGDVATLRMQFVFNTTLFDLMHQSLERTQNCLLFPDWNVPMAAVLPGKLRCKPNELSEEKRKCIEHILCQAPGNQHVSPFVVTGPSGSGKSFTIQQAIALLAKDMKRKVLICCKKSSDVDAYVMDLDRRISGGMLPYTSRPLRILGLSSPVCLQPEVVQYCSQHPSPTQKEVDEHRIIVTTLTASLLLRKDVNKFPAFTHVIIDGMDKANETESIIPLMYAECTQTIVVLTVDPMMCVSPSVHVTPRSTSQNELSHFLTDRLKMLQENENQMYLFPLKRLSGKSFDIIHFLSNAFYDGKLEVENEYPGSPSALSFYYKRGLETPQGLSYFNEAEAKEVFEVAQEIAAFSEDIAVISPFLAQVNLLEKYFDGLPKPIREKVTILSPESVPGTQFESTLLSTVRTPRYVTGPVDFGSLEERKTLNSVFACARLHIVVFGDPFLLSKANQNDVWKHYFRICDEKGTLSPEDLCFEKIDNLQMFTQPCAKYKPPVIKGKRKKLSHDGISADKGVLSDSEGDFGEIGTEPDSLAEKVYQHWAYM